MAPNDDSQDPDRPEDNPFIAFRRFADSQVSSLMNSLVTLPATFANFNNAHVAREQCLFGRADKAQCEELAQLEDQVAHLRSEGQELYRVGDLQAVLHKGEELLKLDRQAEEMRKEIVETARKSDDEARRTYRSLAAELQQELRTESGQSSGQQTDTRRLKQLVEKVANEKGQQWGWSWDWGFPRPFDAEENTFEQNSCDRMRRWRRNRQKFMTQEIKEDPARFDEIKKGSTDDLPYSEERQPKMLYRSFQWPDDAPRREAPFDPQSVKARIEAIMDHIGNAIADEVPRMFDSRAYSPATLEESEETKLSGVDWRDAFEDLIRIENGAPRIPPQQLGRNKTLPYDQWARRFHDPAVARSEFSQWVTHPEHAVQEAEASSEEPSYEYAHDHEDQHDDPPTPKAKQSQWGGDMPETELDAYERLLDKAHAPGVPSKEESRPLSILSTLTTTVRSVAPDGTVTTKVVLKKRFADGREENSETVHTQRGNRTDTAQPDHWDPLQNLDPSSQQEQRSEAFDKDKGKKRGWFWSN